MGKNGKLLYLKKTAISKKKQRLPGTLRTLRVPAEDLKLRSSAVTPLRSSRAGGTGHWRGHGAGVARTVSHFWLGVARAWRRRGAGLSCSPRKHGARSAHGSTCGTALL
eukprot:gene7317-biopygen4544